MFRNFLILFTLLVVFNCKQKEAPSTKTESADGIIKKAIEVAGGTVFDHSEIDFDFRDTHYKAIHDNGKFQLERYLKDSISEIKDVLSNSGLERFENGAQVKLADSMVEKYSASVNSVHYFSVLPYGLDGKAVYKNFLGTKNINGNAYYKIKVTFSEDGGGEDFDDEFIYWIDTQTFTLDYLAYSYKEDDGRDFRFREAYNVRIINGLRFADYNNYKPKKGSEVEVNLENLDDQFSADNLELLSKIELKNIEVKVLN